MIYTKEVEYIVYARKSTETEERQALSIPAQIRELEEFASKENLTIKEVLEESKSASKPNNRPVFISMINKIKSGECKRILVWHSNRLSRNPMESGIIMQMLSDKTLEEIRTPNSSITPDNANDILLGVEFGANSQFSRELSKNTIRGLKQKALRGEYPTYAPPFYINVGTGKGFKNIEPDEKISMYYEKLVDKVINEKIRITNAYEILREWEVKSHKGKYFSRNCIARMLRSPVYYGEMSFHDIPELIKGTWKPLITKEKWLKLQDVLDGKSKPYTTKFNHPFRKTIRCTKCGYHIVGYTKTKKSGKTYTYYGCSKRGGKCPNSTLTLDELEQQLFEIACGVEITDETRTKIKNEVNNRLDSEMTIHKTKNSEYINEIEEIDKKLDNLLRLRMNGEISPEEYQKYKQELLMRRSDLEALQGDLGYSREDVRKQLELFIDTCFQIKDLFINGTNDERTLLMQTIGENYKLEDGTIRWNYKKPWSNMVNQDFTAKNFNWGGRWVSNPRPPLPQRGALTN